MAALYGVHASNYLVPLITIPYLSRMLGVEGWGLVAFAQSFGQSTALIVEYGFNLSATREVACHADDRSELARIFASVTLAKLLLCVGASAGGVVAYVCVPRFQESPTLLLAAMVLGMSQGMSLMWLYQGMERMRLLAALEIASRVLVVGLIVAFVRRPDHVCRTMMLYALGPLLSTVCAYIASIRTLGFPRPHFREAWWALQMGFTMFLFRSSAALYTVGNSFILGLLTGPRVVGIYSGAERISRAVVGLANPFGQALFPRMNVLLSESRERAAALARRVFGVAMAASVGVALLVIACAPLVVSLFLGPNFHESVLVLRLLSLLIPTLMASNLLGVQWMLPLRLDSPFNAIIISAGLVNLFLASILAPSLKAPGMAISVVLAEGCVSVACFLYLQSKRIGPLGGSHLTAPCPTSSSVGDERRYVVGDEAL